MEPRHIIRAAIALSVIGHLALAVGVLFADARPFDTVATRDIAVDIVTPEQVAKASENAQPDAEPVAKPEPPKQPEPFRLPDLTIKPTLEDQNKPPAPTAQSAPAKSSPAAAAPAAAQQSAQQPPPSQAMPSQTMPSPATPPPGAQQPALQQQAALQPPSGQSTPAESAAPPRAEPDITAKYGVMFGLPDGNGGAEAITNAKIAPVDITAFRRHLQSCSMLPAAVSRGDKVRIVLRAFLAPNGRLMTEPMLIEASASAKGPLLMQAAMKALQACQPYAMLPADKYDEWKVLDLSFTPQDFAG